MDFSLFGLSTEASVAVNIGCVVILIIWIFGKFIKRFKLANNKHTAEIRQSAKRFVDDFSDSDDLK